MSKKFFPVFLVLTGTILFLAFQTQGKSDDNPKSKNEKILQNVGMLLEEGHLSPRTINDDFSNLQEMYCWCEENQDKCEEIIQALRLHLQQGCKNE